VSRGFYLFVGTVSWPVVRGLFRLRTRGLENLPPSGGFVIGANHVSNLDPFAIGIPLWPKRRLRWMAKIELFKPVLGKVITAGGAFPVRRGHGDVDAIQTGIRVCREGDVLVMFPEGTRRRKGLQKRFEPRPHTGAARIALAAGVPLLPAAIKGTEHLARLPQIRVAYGSEISTSDLRDVRGREAAQIATERLMQQIERLESSL
jgi:1-acyl-sn-glycerol-3-phosphate acyltransferase